MAVSEEFKNAVDQGKMTRVRIMLKDSMLVDPNLKLFEERLDYAQKSMSDLFDEHDGEVLIDDPSKWTEDYMNQQMAAVVFNFSRERVDLLKKIVPKVYNKTTAKEEINEEKQRNFKKEKVSVKQTSNSNHQLAVGLAVGGGVVAIAGICLSKIIITAAGGVVAAVGIGMLVTEGKE